MYKNCLLVQNVLILFFKMKILVLFVFYAALLDLNNAQCTNSIFTLNYQPVIVKNQSPPQFIYPIGNEPKITVNSGEQIQVSCNASNTFQATCISNSVYQVQNGEKVNFNEFECDQNVPVVVQYTGGRCAFGTGIEIEIGFAINQDFARLILVCFDDYAKSAIYEEHLITKKIDLNQKNVARVKFGEGGVFNLGVSVDDLYKNANQRSTINNLLGLAPNDTRYIASNGNNYLARGHLAAKTDFFYDPQQRATFQFSNAAPQWQGFNNGNWKYLENDVRDFASNNGVDLVVYTGTYGLMTLPHSVTNNSVPLYLYVDPQGQNNAIPVPQLFWKVMYEPQSQKGVAFVGVNNPYQTNLTQGMICTDLFSTYHPNWFSWNQNNTNLGFIYVCDVNDFRRTINYLPSFPVSGLI